jgi:hypothetical protein
MRAISAFCSSPDLWNEVHCDDEFYKFDIILGAAILNHLRTLLWCGDDGGVEFQR